MRVRKITAILSALLLGNSIAFQMLTLEAGSYELAALPKAHLIVPGERIGPAWVGRKPSPNFFPELGKPDITQYQDEPSTYAWKCKDQDCSVIIKTSGSGDAEIVAEIYVSEKNIFRTQSGIGVGSTFQEVKKAFPAGKKIPGLDVDFCWSIPGAGFCIYKEKVCFITVMQPLAE